MHEVKSIEELDDFIINNSSEVVMIYFGAKWCGPCNNLKKKLTDEENISRLPRLKVCYIDIDENEDITNIYKIKSLPTQLFIKLNNNKVKVIYRIEGYDFTQLIINYDKYTEIYYTPLDI